MRGGIKVYRGSPAAPRHYVEADRSRADDDYLAEGSGLADRFVALLGAVIAKPAMDGDTSEGWVGGLDVDSGLPKGRLRTDGDAVQFVEVVVNGPEDVVAGGGVEPEISAAYDAAQHRAAVEIIGWLRRTRPPGSGHAGGRCRFRWRSSRPPWSVTTPPGGGPAPPSAPAGKQLALPLGVAAGGGSSLSGTSRTPRSARRSEL